MGKTKVQKIGFLVGIVAMLVIGFMPTPEGLSLVGQRVLAVTVLMVVFWITEAMPIPFTALLPIFLFPVMQITGSKGQNDITLFAHYAYSTCYLLVGVGFLSGAMVKHGLHKRIALGIVSKVGKMPPTDISIARRQYEELGPMNKGEKWVAAIFVLCVILWVTRSLVWGDWFPYATDETIAMFGAILVMIAPMDYKKGEYVCDWKTGFNDIPWNAVILLGGSMVMGNAFRDAGCAEWIANMLSGLAGMNSILIVILVGIVTAVLTELTTNAVVVAAFIPVLAGVGEAIGVSPFAMMIACMLACNFAFMLPPGTPPNAIAYGSGEIELKDMLKCGLGLKLIALIIFPIVLYFITMGIFGVGTV